MSQILKNIIVLVIFAGLAAVGYFMFLQPDNSLSTFRTDESLANELLIKTQVFIEHRAVLESLNLDLSLFNDPRFQSLQSYSTEVPAQSIGKSDLFEEAQPVPVSGIR